MLKQAGATDTTALRKRWQEWTAVVARSARHHGNGWVTYERYHALHDDLLKTCRSQALAAEGEERVFIQGLEALARPWLTPDTLARTDPEILHKLLERCRQAGRELGCKESGISVSQWFIAVVLATLALLVVSPWLLDYLGVTFLRPLRYWAETGWSMLFHSSGIPLWFGAAMVVIAGSIILIWRTGRT